MTGEQKALLGIGLVTVLIFIGGLVALTRKESVPTGPVDSTLLVREDSHALGAENPQVTLVEFADYQCPFCAQSHPFIQALVAKYGEQVQFVYRHFPLLQHQHAQLAAEAAEAAGAQGQYWQMHDLIYAGQTEWSEAADALPIFQSYAEQLELDLEQFNQSVENRVFQEKIQQGLADGNAVGVSGTPTFFIDGEKFSGSLNGLEAAIQEKLQTTQDQ